MEKQPIKFIFKQDKLFCKEEEVKIENWVWVAIYQDNTELHQFNIDGTFHQIGEIDQSKVKLFVLYQPSDLGKKAGKRIDIVVPEGAKLIHKYRHYILNFGTDQKRKVKIYIFGIKYKGGHFVYNYIMPDGRIIQSEREDLSLTEYGI